MIDVRTIRQSMTQWNLFLSSCVFVAGLALKVGAPLSAVLGGIAVAGLFNVAARYRRRVAS